MQLAHEPLPGRLGRLGLFDHPAEDPTLLTAGRADHGDRAEDLYLAVARRALPNLLLARFVAPDLVGRRLSDVAFVSLRRNHDRAL